MYLICWHGTMITSPDSNGKFSQVAIAPGIDLNCLFSVTIEKNDAKISDGELVDLEYNDTPVSCEMPAGVHLTKRGGQREVNLKRDGYFLAAEPSGELQWNRKHPGRWETFFLVAAAEVELLAYAIGNGWELENGIASDSGMTKLISGFHIEVDRVTVDLRHFLGLVLNQTNSITQPKRNEVVAYEYSMLVGEKSPDLRLFLIPTAYRSKMRDAIKKFHLGQFSEALCMFESLRSAYGETDELVYHMGLVQSRLRHANAREPLIFWRKDPPWEQDWMRSILPQLQSIDVAQNLEALTDRTLIVIDNEIKGVRSSFYRQVFEFGCKVILFHLSDEFFEDNHDVYRWCNMVFRNYYSPVLKMHQNVQFFALGFKTGFCTNELPIPIENREHLWCFAGDPNKSTRNEMLSAMRRIGPGFEHLTSGFDSTDALNIASYRNVMRHSIFVPCPVGNVNLDTFRVYEALEGGCIPIVEKRENFGYFVEAYGDWPVPSVKNWDECRGLIDQLRSEEGSIAALMKECRNWWYKYKNFLRARISSAINNT